MHQIRNIVILTGAGISAASGVRTFRDAGGLWEGHRIEEVATPEGYAANPDLVQKMQSGAALSAPDSSTFYTPGEKGYTDY